MWGLWLGPLLLIAGLAGLFIAIGIVIQRRIRTGRWFDGRGTTAALLAPVGCVAVPLAALLALSLYGQWVQASDSELYAEIFGAVLTPTDDRLLFDDFGDDYNRAIYMRAEPSPTEYAALLRAAPWSASTLSQADFDRLGEAHGFSWWEADSCIRPIIRSADGHRGWTQLTLFDCREQGRVYVIAAITVG